ncbi:2',3'-cyclic-nucleotide 3'-phosphodiesterase-like [Ptychodera flava]|uniref:2',3'-cyclic-nucleotide 3'-phosphodiesterase-like n=1 Tax=Ptychodera flava TaxID=63121 RepID=UPI003969D8ED
MGNDQVTHISGTAGIKILALTAGVACCLAYVVFKLAPDIMASYRNRRKGEQCGKDKNSDVDWEPDELVPAQTKGQHQNAEIHSEVDGQRWYITHPGDQLPGQPDETEKIVRDPTLEFPVLTDPKTIEYIKKSKVMFIMRGLSGSGKSVIAEVIRETYENSIICCADNFFNRPDGRYVWRKEGLQEVHDKCHKLAEDSCKKGINVVVIDNTNVRAWEAQFYLDLAKRTDYVVVLVEPKTSWKFDAYELARKNKHGVAFSMLQKKVESFDTMIPLFFGWFLNYTDSTTVRYKGNKIYRQLQKEAEFVEKFKMCVKGDPDAYLNFNTYYSVDSLVVGPVVLHCTSKFCGRGKVPDSYKYLKNADVSASLGAAFTTHIIGFFFTAKTFGARLKLTSRQVELWGQEDEQRHVEEAEARINRVMSAGGSRRTAGPFLSYELRGTGFDRPVMTLERRGASGRPSQLRRDFTHPSKNFQPTSGVGSRSHCTLSCAAGVSAVQTGLDLVEIIQMEQEAAEFRDQNVTMSQAIPDGWLRCYDDKAWVVYLSEPITVGSLFSGFY